MIKKGRIVNTLIACLIIAGLFLLTSCDINDQLMNNETDHKEVYESPHVEPVIVDAVENKEELRQQYIQHVDQEMTSDEKTARTTELTYELVQMFSNNESEQIINAVMQSKHVYRLVLSGSEQISTSDDHPHISLQIPYVFYDAVTDRWIVASGGVWKDDSWFDSLAEQSFEEEDGAYVARIGGADKIGLQYDQITGDYPERITGDAYITDQKGMYENTVNPNIGDPGRGIAFNIYDRAISKKKQGSKSPDDLRFLGKGFAVFAVYDSKFTQFSGMAKTVYIHSSEKDDQDGFTASSQTIPF